MVNFLGHIAEQKQIQIIHNVRVCAFVPTSNQQMQDKIFFF